MEPISLPLERGGALADVASTPLWRRNTIQRHHHASSAQSLSPRTMSKEQQLMRRVSSYQDAARGGQLKIDRVPRKTYGAGGALLSGVQDSWDESASESSRLLFREESSRHRLLQQASSSLADDGRATCKEKTLEALVNLTSGVIAFLLSSTLTVSCASVIVGHGTPLATVIAHFIDMNLLGTAILSLVLAWQSQAPWTLGAIDVFV